MTDLRFQASTVDMYLHQGDDVSFLARLWVEGRSVLDLVLTVGSTTATSERAEFTEADEGSPLLCPNLPEGTTIDTFVSDTEVTLSAPADSSSQGAAATIYTPYPLDLSGEETTALAQIRAKPSKTSPVLATCTVTLGPGELPADEGYLSLDIAAADVAKLPAGPGKKAYWDIQTIIDGKTKTHMKGTVYADAEVSQLVPA